MYIGRIISQDSTDIKFYRIKDGTALEMTFKKSDLAEIATKSAKPGTIAKSDKRWIAEKGSIGLGIGLDYGMAGINLTAYPHNNFGLTIGLGRAFSQLGFNFGLKIRKNPEKSNTPMLPYLSMLYGTNTIVIVFGREDLNMRFSGFTMGGGIDIRLSKKSWHSISLGILVPIRSTEVDNYILELKSRGLEIKNTTTPVLGSFGVKFGF